MADTGEQHEMTRMTSTGEQMSDSADASGTSVPADDGVNQSRSEVTSPLLPQTRGSGSSASVDRPNTSNRTVRGDLPDSVVDVEAPRSTPDGNARPAQEQRSETSNDSITAAVREKRASNLRQLIEFSEPDSIRQEIQHNLLLHEAVRQDSVEILIILLNKLSYDDNLLFLVDAKNQNKTALHCSVELKHEECFNALMEKNAKCLIQKDDSANTALHYIAQHGFTKGCQIARMNPLEDYLKTENSKRFTPMHTSAWKGNAKILKIFLEEGGSPDSTTGLKYTPLHFAAAGGSRACVELLIDAKDENHTMSAEVQNDTSNNEDKIKYMNTQTKLGETALIMAAKKGFTKCIQLLNGTNPELRDKKGNTALHYAVSKGHLTVVKLLVESFKANTSIKNKNMQTLLQFAPSSRNENCLVYLQKKTTVPPNEAPGLLKIATVNNYLMWMTVMLKCKDILSFIDHQYTDDDNNTLLHMSIKSGHYKITQLLLRKGANKAIANKKGEYPLHLAAARCCEEGERLHASKEILINSSELVNEVNSASETALHLAARSGNVLFVESLLRKGSNVLSRDKEEMTPFDVAAQSGQHACVKILMNSLSDHNRNKLTESKSLPLHHPLHLAAESGHISTCQVIVQMSDKHLWVKLKSNKKYPVDVAYDKNHFDVFLYLLMKMERKDEEEFSCRVHQYCKQSIKDQNSAVIDAVIDSPWCHVAFDGRYCSNVRKHVRPNAQGTPHHLLKPCDSFSNLVKDFPKAASKVMDRHITVAEDRKTEVHNYVPFEFLYYNVDDRVVTSPFYSQTGNVQNIAAAPTTLTEGTDATRPESTSAEGTDAARRKGTPYELKSSAEVFQDVVWGRDHPLLQATTVRHKEVLTHPLTRSWLESKYTAYAKKRLWIYIFLEVMFSVTMAAIVYFIWNTHHLEKAFSGASRHELCSVYEDLPSWYHNNTVKDMETQIRETSMTDKNCSQFSLPAWNVTNTTSELHYPPGSAVWNRSVCAIANLQTWTYATVGLYVTAWVIFILNGILAVIYTIKLLRVCSLLPLRNLTLISTIVFGLKEVCKDCFHLTRWLRLCLLLPLLTPTSCCDLLFGLRKVWIWQTGILSLLMFVLHTVGGLNKIPALTLFLPFSKTLVNNYLIFSMYMFIILFVFALSFHLLLSEVSPAFSTVLSSLVKMLTWMFGDFNYDETFVPKDYFAKILFVIFILFLSGFVYNIILRNPEDELKKIKESAAFHEIHRNVKLHLLIDDYFPGQRRRHARSQRVIQSERYRVIDENSRLHNVKTEEDQDDVKIVLIDLIQKIERQNELLKMIAKSNKISIE